MANIRYGEHQLNPYDVAPIQPQMKSYRVTMKSLGPKPLVTAHSVNMNIPFVFFLLNGEPIAWFNAAEVLMVEAIDLEKDLKAEADKNAGAMKRIL